jgi:hypothetical protein
MKCLTQLGVYSPDQIAARIESESTSECSSQSHIEKET